MCRGVEAECESISTLNFIFSGSSICFWFCLVTLSLSLSVSLSRLPVDLFPRSPFHLPFMAAAFGRCDDWRCLSEAASTVLSRIAKIQECFTPEHLHLSKHGLAFFFFFSEQAVATGPSKRNSQRLRLETWEEKRHKIWRTGALFRHNYILLSPLSFACQNITQLTRAVIQLPSKCPAFPFAASAVDGLHNYSCSDCC